MNKADKRQSDTDHFPIRELSARTEVNTVTLRAWERRYGLLKPQRTAKGHRLYSEEDVATIEKILALVARGVPIGKVKPLLQDDLPQKPESHEDENWESLITSLLSAIDSFSDTKLEHTIHECLSSYPVAISRERIMEPLFTELGQRPDHGASLGFAESELLRYTCLRLSTKSARKNRTGAVTLMAGNQAPIWRLALMAIELVDKDYSVILLNRPLSLAASIELSERIEARYSIFYQDGVWNEKEKILASSALEHNTRLLMCGTAPVLTRPSMQEQVFADIKECIAGLASRK